MTANPPCECGVPTSCCQNQLPTILHFSIDITGGCSCAGSNVSGPLVYGTLPSWLADQDGWIATGIPWGQPPCQDPDGKNVFLAMWLWWEGEPRQWRFVWTLYVTTPENQDCTGQSTTGECDEFECNPLYMSWLMAIDFQCCDNGEGNLDLHIIVTE
jgi:hypothetical protein